MSPQSRYEQPGPSGRGHRRPPATGPGSRRGFGSTWWGRAWVEALEDRARLDPNRLPRGRSYARSGAVGALDVSPGQVQAAVQGSRPAPYSVTVRVRAFTPAEWDRVLDAVAAQIGHTAALLDGELSPEVADDVASAGLDLLPVAGEVGPRCSCPDWADPCKHAAAVCYLVADVLDADPFALLLLRGRARGEVLAGLRARRRTTEVPSRPAGPRVPPPDEGVEARDAHARIPGPLPPLPLPPLRPGRPAVLAVDPPPGSGVQREDMLALAADAATRAWELASGEGDGGLILESDHDIARRAASLLGQPGFGLLAARAGVPARDLVRWATAWQRGGSGGLNTLRSPWTPPKGGLDEGASALETAGHPAARTWRNRLTAGDLQLRLGQDGLWYRFTRAGTEWELDHHPHPDPHRLLGDPRTRQT